MLVLTAVLVFYVIYRKQRISFFPVRFSKGYIIATCIAGILYITAPANYVEGFSVTISVYQEVTQKVKSWFVGNLTNQY